MAGITVNLYLYGELAAHAGEARSYGYANLRVPLKQGARVRDVLERFGIPTEKRGVSFINGKLSAMPGLQPDLDYVLGDNDRVALFDPKSMWPFQYRHGVVMTDGMAEALSEEANGGLRHTYGQH